MVVGDPYLVDLSQGSEQIPLSTLTCLLLFGVNHILYLSTCAYDVFTGKSVENGDRKVSKRVQAIELTKKSFMECSREIFILGNILLYAWICENRPLFAQGGKSHALDFFWFLTIALIICSSYTFHRDVKEDAIVNRDQTEEWKGWMQVMFLLYHYFHVAEVYNVIRVLISCYVWMTGFGNLSFFYAKRDFSFVRAYQMIWRMNFLVFFLCMVMNNMYILYYICPLHTFYFMFTFVTMYIRNDLNHTKWGLRFKIFCAAVFIFFVWEFDTIFNLAFFWLPSTHHPGAAVGATGIQFEWHFRSGLDHYSTLFGMIYALNFPQTTLWLKQVEQEGTLSQQVIIKGMTAVVLLGAFVWWFTTILPLEKHQYNQVHPYTFFIPLITYLFIRNITPGFRQRHMTLLAAIGKTTLETYLMQHHIWLTSNAKTLLVIFPGWEKVNMAIVTFIYVMLSRILFRLTISLRARLIPETLSGALNSAFGLSFVWGGFGIVAWVCQMMQFSWLLVGITIIILSACAMLFCTSILTKKVEVEVFLSGNIASSRKIASYCLAMIVLIFSLLIPRFLPMGLIVQPDGPLRPPPLTAHGSECIQYANNLIYSSDETCMAHSSQMNCGAKSWGWDGAVQKACRFHEYDSVAKIKLLQSRTIAFVGDESVYKLMNSVSIGLTGSSIASVPDSTKVLKYKVNGVELRSSTIVNYYEANGIKDVSKIIKGLPSEELDVIVFGAWLDDAKADISSAAYSESLQALKRKNPGKQLIWLQPQAVFEDLSVSDNKGFSLNEKAHKYSLSVESKGIPSIGMFNLTKNFGAMESVDGILYTPTVYETSVQIFLNIVSKLKLRSVQPDPVFAADKKTKSSGVAENPFYGFGVLVIVMIMILTMDSYAGVSFFFKFAAGHPSKVTWEESVDKLHRGIFKQKQVPDGEQLHRIENGKTVVDEVETLLKEGNN